MRDAFTNAVQQLVSACIISPVQGRLESDLVCRSVAFEYKSTQTQQGCAVVSAVVDTIFKCR
jgi:hypothetical protein